MGWGLKVITIANLRTYDSRVSLQYDRGDPESLDLKKGAEKKTRMPMTKNKTHTNYVVVVREEGGDHTMEGLTQMRMRERESNPAGQSWLTKATTNQINGNERRSLRRNGGCRERERVTQTLPRIDREAREAGSKVDSVGN